MKAYGRLDSLLRYSPPQESYYFASQNADDNDKSGTLEDLLEEKLRSLSEILNGIKHDIESRGDVSNNIIYQIGKHYCYLKTKLFELYTWGFGRSQIIENRRSKLERQLDNLNQEKRGEEVRCWQDIAVLKKEFRTWFKQYCDVLQRVKIVLGDKILQSK